MTEATRYEFGADVTCSDGADGTLKRVVLDPATRSLTHLVVEPRHRVGMARLVPFELVESAGASIRLRCSAPEFGHLEAAETAPVLPEADFGYGEVGALDGFGGNGAPPIFFDTVPVGEVEVAGGDRLWTSDGHIGHVRGLVVDPQDRRITYVLLQEGHLWRHKDVAISIADVADLSDGIRLRLSKREVQDLGQATSPSPG